MVIAVSFSSISQLQRKIIGQLVRISSILNTAPCRKQGVISLVEIVGTAEIESGAVFVVRRGYDRFCCLMKQLAAKGQALCDFPL